MYKNLQMLCSPVFYPFLSSRQSQNGKKIQDNVHVKATLDMHLEKKLFCDCLDERNGKKPGELNIFTFF